MQHSSLVHSMRAEWLGTKNGRRRPPAPGVGQILAAAGQLREPSFSHKMVRYPLKEEWERYGRERTFSSRDGWMHDG